MTGFDPVPALRVLLSHDVRFVIIGGVAGSALGSPLITQDLDICYDRSRENLVRLAEALKELHATLRGAPEGLPFLLDAETLERGDAFTFTTTAGPLDILGTPRGSGGFDALERDAISAPIDGLEVRVASLEDLIAMKRAAGRPQDIAAVEILGGLRDELEGRPEEEYHPPGEQQ